MQGVRSSAYSKSDQEKLPDLVFVLYAEEYDKGYNVYAIDTNGGGGDDIKMLFYFSPSHLQASRDDMRMVVCGSKLCAVGSGFVQKMGKFPREFLQFDLTNWKTRGADDFKPDDTPKPKGAKPSPAVFVHNYRLYALAGMLYPSNSDIPDPAFEVYDPFDEDGDWEPLEIPFQDFYHERKGKSKRCLIGHKVVEETLYVLFSNSSEGHIFYTYSFENDAWEAKINFDDYDTLLANLTWYGKYYGWTAREDFSDWFGFHLSGTKVLAHDLKAEVDESKIRKDHNVWPAAYYDIEDEYPFLAVHGLEHIYAQKFVECDVKESTSGFVAHLRDNIYYVVYIIYAGDKQQIHACKFELHKEGTELHAKILGCADYYPPSTWIFGNQWGKMESKSSYLDGLSEGVSI